VEENTFWKCAFLETITKQWQIWEHVYENQMV
jgi:hypothetical protein